VIEAAAHEVGVINEARLHCVAQCHSQHQIAASAAHVVGDSQRYAEVIRGMAGFGLSKEVIHEIDITHECRVPEGSVDRVCFSAADQRAWTCATELGDLLVTGLNRASAQGGNAAT
jgi:hypothetical protein